MRPGACLASRSSWETRLTKRDCPHAQIIVGACHSWRDAGAMEAAPGVARRPWGWFVAWWFVGGLWSLTLLGAASVGLLVLPGAMAATAILVWRSRGLGLIGLLSGLGLPVFYVAYLNWGGPGNVCTPNAGGGQACVQESSPWPWLAVAVALTIAGTILFIFRHDRHGAGTPKFWQPS